MTLFERDAIHAGGRTLIERVRVPISRGKRYGLIGRNGQGKSTLLRVIQEDVSARHHDGASVSVALVDQEMRKDGLDDTKSLLEWVAEGDATYAELERNEFEGECGDGNYEQQLLRQQLMSDIDSSTARTRAAKLLYGLGFTSDMQRQTHATQLSGGWRTRLYLARALYTEPAMLLLDEPTNHLDLDAVSWLGAYLCSPTVAARSSVIVVSHDRGFLENVTTDVLEVRDGRLLHHVGGFRSFEVARSLREREAFNSFVRSSKKKTSGGGGLNNNNNNNKKSVLRKQVEQYQRARKDAVHFDFDWLRNKTVDYASGRRRPPPSVALLQLADVGLDVNSPPKTLLKHVDLGIYANSRFAIVGRNGTGKTTLMRVLGEEIRPTTGEVRRWPHLRVASYSQHFDTATPNPTPANIVSDHLPDDLRHDQQLARELLGRFGVTGVNQVSLVERLSGGQKARVAFASICARCPHMILDEPTNNLDMESIDALTEGLRNFGGGVVVVSHDQRLLERLCDEDYECPVQNGQYVDHDAAFDEEDDDETIPCGSIVVMNDGMLQPFSGTFTEYRGTLLI